MRHSVPLVIALLLAGCGGGGGGSSSADLTLEIGDKLVLITTGYVDNRVDWIVVRAYPAGDMSAAENDDRVRFEPGDAVVKLPDGSSKSLKGTSVLFYLDDEGVEAHDIRLHREDMDVLHTEAFENVRAMIEMLSDMSQRYG